MNRNLPGVEFSKTDMAALEAEGCMRSLDDFSQEAWKLVQPGRKLIWTWHLGAICEHLQAVSEGQIKRLLINVPYRTGKSLFTSVFWPCWDWINHPERQFLGVSYAMRLAQRDAVRSRRLLTSGWYQGHWGSRFALSLDQNVKSNYSNNYGGIRLSAGMNGGVMGEGADILVIDDPHDRASAHSDVERPRDLTTYDEALTTRLNEPKNSAIVIIMQRLHEEDLSGHVLKRERDDWEHLMLPMEFEIDRRCKTSIGFRDPRTKDGELLCPERVGPKDLAKMKVTLGEYAIAGQLQQKPVPDGGGIIKKHWWKKWPKGKALPPRIHVFSSIDTAFSEKDDDENAYSARTTWLVFEDETTFGKHALLLIGAWYERVGYPQLRKELKDHYRKDDPDLLLIERKASGISMIQDLKKHRRPRFNVRGFNPGKMDKRQRAHLASNMFERGLVYYPEGKKWAEEVLDYVAAFPAGAAPSADIMDTVSQAVLYTRNRGWMEPIDESADDQPHRDPTEEELEDSADEGEYRSVYG